MTMVIHCHVLSSQQVLSQHQPEIIKAVLKAEAAIYHGCLAITQLCQQCVCIGIEGTTRQLQGAITMRETTIS